MDSHPTCESGQVHSIVFFLSRELRNEISFVIPIIIAPKGVSLASVASCSRY